MQVGPRPDIEIAIANTAQTLTTKKRPFKILQSLKSIAETLRES